MGQTLCIVEVKFSDRSMYFTENKSLVRDLEKATLFDKPSAKKLVKQYEGVYKITIHEATV